MRKLQAVSRLPIIIRRGGVSLPAHAFLTEADIDRIVAALADAIG
jgi:dTDP-4-amino-4,6-dideoxygalactose transaminase